MAPAASQVDQRHVVPVDEHPARVGEGQIGRREGRRALAHRRVVEQGHLEAVGRLQLPEDRLPLSRQVLEHAAHDCDLASAEGRVKLLAQAIPLLQHLPEGGLRTQIAMDLADKARCPFDEVRARLNATPDARGGRGPARPSGATPQRPRRQAQPPSAHDHGEPPEFDLPSDDDIASAMAGMDDADWSAMGDPGTGWDVPDEASHGGGDSYGGGNRQGEGRFQRRDKGGRGDWKGGKGNWRGRRDAGGWDRASRPPDRPLPQAARPLERAAWMLLHRADLWEHLPPDVQQMLCEQGMPLGAFFCWLDRVLMDEGPLQAPALLERLSADANSQDGLAGDIALLSLVQRLAGLHEVTLAEQSADDIVSLVQPLQLRALNDELELLLQSGELSEQAEARKLELITRSTQLKRTISQKRPVLQ